jgi:hypothetical protein
MQAGGGQEQQKHDDSAGNAGVVVVEFKRICRLRGGILSDGEGCWGCHERPERAGRYQVGTGWEYRQ